MAIGRGISDINVTKPVAEMSQAIFLSIFSWAVTKNSILSFDIP